jgi:hypothetical protein
MSIEFEDCEFSPLEGELAAILRALLCRSGGKLSIEAHELPTRLYTIDVDHTDDGGIDVYLHEGAMQ